MGTERRAFARIELPAVRRPARNGFTLIELLVVIAIIALLVSILVPSLGQAKDLAYDVYCLNNVRNVSLAVRQYTMDFDDQLPYNAGHSDANPNSEGWTGWWCRVGRVPENQKPSRASLVSIYRDGYIDYNRQDYDKGNFKCPTANKQIEPKWKYVSRWDAHYGMNDHVLGSQDNGAPWRVTCKKLSNFPGGLVMLSDAHLGWYPLANGGAGGMYFWSGLSLNPWWYAYDPWPHQYVIGGIDNDFEGHTGNRSNVSRLDGSVSAVDRLTWEDFMTR